MVRVRVRAGVGVIGGVRVRGGQQFFEIMLLAYVNRGDYHILSKRIYLPALSSLLQVTVHGAACIITGHAQ